MIILLILHEDRAGSGKPLKRGRIIEMLKEYRMFPKNFVILLFVNSIIGFGVTISIHNTG